MLNPALERVLAFYADPKSWEKREFIDHELPCPEGEISSLAERDGGEIARSCIKTLASSSKPEGFKV